MKTVNIAAYKFVGIPEPDQWIAPLKERCVSLNLKGTVLLAQEGINLFLAGSSESIDTFMQYLQNDEVFAGKFQSGLDIKESFSETQPFKKMVVRVANEIITMRHPTIRPEDARAADVDAKTLKKWLDQGRDDDGREVVLLDTRNAFEVEMGTFDGAVDLSIEKFGEFPEKIRATIDSVESSLREKTIVSFCTGGIRCEKAVLYLQELGLRNVFQLDGGILRYFEEVGGAHYKGECFVFDERVSLDPDLQASGKTLSDRTDGKPSTKNAVEKNSAG